MKHLLLIASTILVSHFAMAQSDTSAKQSFKEAQQKNEADHIHGKQIRKKSLTNKPAVIAADSVAQPATKSAVQKKKKKSC